MVIYAYDLCMTGTNHVYFNSAMLNMLAKLYTCRIVFYGEKEHIHLVSQLVTFSRIEYRPLPITNYLGAKILLSDFNAIRWYRKSWKRNDISKDDFVIFLNRLPFTMLYANYLNLLEKKKIINILHGELEYLVNGKLKGLTRYYYRVFKWAYKLSSKQSTYVFLGYSIKETVLNHGLKFPNSKLICIDHPYGYDAVRNDNNLLGKEICVSNIGTAAVRKNTYLMPELKNSLNNRNDRIKLMVIGTVEEGLQRDFEKAGILYNKNKASKESYEKQISETHYSLSFFTKEMNIALASGSFFDCIKFAKPIIALSGNPFVDYYFSILGDIGYRFDTIDEMVEFLAKLDESENNHYLEQVMNLEKAQKTLSLENIGKQFKNQMVNSQKSNMYMTNSGTIIKDVKSDSL